MNNPYLIQSARFDNNSSPSKTGIDTILSFDYMGSAEFEFGALPASLKRVRTSIDDYVQFQYSFNKYPTKLVTVFCKKEQQEHVGNILEELAERKIQLKASCSIHSFVKGEEKKSYFNSDFWWDIEQDWFFWKFTPEFDLKFKQTLMNK